jgi:hypothetical protein
MVIACPIPMNLFLMKEAIGMESNNKMIVNRGNAGINGPMVNPTPRASAMGSIANT